MADDQESRVSDRYEMIRLLARGGMADVYLARDIALDRPVAVKVLFEQFATDPNFVERFRREAHAAANLNHPGIVSIYDWGEQDGTYYIVMEYVEGRTLAQIVREEGPLTPQRAAEVVADVAAALGFAHRHGVVHRDVKPGNVLVSPLGQVKVTDFGIARALTTTGNLTQTGTVMGTATYFSPEQARGEPVDPRSDVYSLGVVLYELLVGEPPFAAESPVSMAYKHVSESPVSPRVRDGRIPPALEAVTMKALAKNPANRYATAEDFAADLRRFNDGRAVLAEAVLPPEQVTQAVAAPVDATRAVPAAPATQVVDRVVVDPLPPRRSTAFVVILTALLLVMAGLIYLLARDFADNETAAVDVQVPMVTDLPLTQAQRALVDLGFEVDVNATAESDKPDGVVVSQSPPGNSNAERGSTVTIVVSSGQKLVQLPNLVDRSEAEAKLALRELGFEVDVEREDDEEKEPGTVLRQRPRAGEQLPKGQTVTLVVAAGPGTTIVPNVVGKPVGVASNELGRAELAVRIEQIASDRPRDEVVRTDPGAGAQLKKGDTVTMFVSTGPATTTTTTGSTTTTGGGGTTSTTGGGGSTTTSRP